MPTQDTSEIKNKIMSIFQARGPSLPVHIAKEIELSLLFTSAFLSELFSEKKIKMSHLRVGSSPVYLIPGQEPKLENFASHLKSKEKDAFNLLKEKRVLEDSKQEPAIRVALREIKDFAIPLEKNQKLFWKYFVLSEPELNSFFEETPEIEKPPIEEEPKKEQIEIFDEEEKESKPLKKTPAKRKPSQKKNELFFNKVKEYLSQKEIEISDIIGFSKNDLILKIRLKEEEKLLFAFNKKRITESDLIKAYKKSLELGEKYMILSLGEIPKKLAEFLKAAQNLSSIEKVE